MRMASSMFGNSLKASNGQFNNAQSVGEFIEEQLERLESEEENEDES